MPAIFVYAFVAVAVLIVALVVALMVFAKLRPTRRRSSMPISSHWDSNSTM